ncbi:hypothetical protein L9F63_012058 [Diploptera punctata]|uniref:HEAT repeat-containing protein 6 n=1 Tax=Diploptera punctata TaxID=6984 RepID=A0AAD8AFK7_DIPPU|nr:hypothetical protein L9F63_012058 [Diploptera punctata]
MGQQLEGEEWPQLIKNMAADTSTFGEENRRKFLNLSSKFTNLVHGRSEGDRQQINTLFDDLNSLDFKTSIVSNADRAVLVINQCCSIVPPNDTFLVAKGCQLISNLISKQHVKVEGKTLSLAVGWCVQSLKHCADVAILDILYALEALLRGNGIYVEEQIHQLLGPNGAFNSLLDQGLVKSTGGEKVTLASPWDIQLMIVRCVESLTFATDSKAENVPPDKLKIDHIESCTKILLTHLYAEKHPDQDEIIYCKVLVSSLRGLQNSFQQCHELGIQLLGEVLGIIKTYMLYGLTGYAGLRPQKIFPANLYQCDIQPKFSKEVRGRKSVKVRKKRQKKNEASTSKTSDDNRQQDNFSQSSAQSYCSYTTSDSVNTFLSVDNTAVSLYPTWLKTSDSDFSDTETGQATKVRNMQGRVRQAALYLLSDVIKVYDKKVLFGYWSCLLPDAPNMQQVPTLCTCLFKDPSPRNRMLVLQVLTLMLIGSRPYLSQAEKRHLIRKTTMSFTPFSVTVGNMVSELHHSLLMVLSIENSVAVITLLLKCLAALVQNTPYHRLEPGLITKLATHVRPYFRHKDINLQVLSLSVFGSIVAVEPTTPEITELLTKCSVFNNRQQSTGDAENKNTRDTDQDSVQDADFEEAIEEVGALLECQSIDNMSWLLDVCLRKLNIHRMAQDGDFALRSGPLQVESLQVLSILTKKYFKEVISRHLSSVMLVLVPILSDSLPAMSFHAARVVDALGNSMILTLQEQGDKKAVSLDKCVQFWQTVLSGPLIALVQDTEQAMLRTVGCDCLTSIGTQVFEELPRDRQILIITLLFGCTHDEENNVRASAIRALAVCVLYPSLREDIHFIMDTAECVMRTVQDKSLLVRINASWSLGNLSDALVLNMNSEEIEDISADLLLKLIETSIKGFTRQ